MKKIIDHVVGLPEVSGMTTINHAARLFLKLNCSEYVMMNYIVQCAKNKQPLEMIEAYKKTGFNEREQMAVTQKLMTLGFIEFSPDPVPRITGKWDTAFCNLDVEFEQFFWTKDGKVLWPTSSKKSAKEFYSKVRKDISREYIVAAVNDYFEFLEWTRKNGFDRAAMMAERFLNPKNEIYLSDWGTAAENEKQKYKANHPDEFKQEVKTITKEERAKEYE